MRCLSHIAPLTPRGDVEIILVDNGSTDGTSQAVSARWPEVRTVALPFNLGVAAGRNTGLQTSTGHHLMILDNDTMASPDTILALSAYLDSHPDTGLVAPRLVSPSGQTQASFKPFPGILSKLRNVMAGKRRSSIARHIPSAPFEPFYVIGAAQMFTREVYRTSGGLDESIFFGPEDADFCMSVRSQGKKVVYLPALTITHEWQRATSGRLFSAAARRHISGLLHFYRKHRRWLR